MGHAEPRLKCAAAANGVHTKRADTSARKKGMQSQIQHIQHISTKGQATRHLLEFFWTFISAPDDVMETCRQAWRERKVPISITRVVADI